MENNIQVYLLSGVDKSMEGFSLGGWNICTIHEKLQSNEKELIPGVNLYQKITTALYGTFPLSCAFCNSSDDNGKYYICLTKQTSDLFSAGAVINALRLVKNSDFGTYFPMSFNSCGGLIVNIPYGLANNYSHSIPKLSLTDDGSKIEKLYANIIALQKSDIRYQMLNFFNEAYRTANKDIAFILRVIILEMLIKRGKYVKKRLSESVANLLSLNKNDYEKIYNDCQKIYTVRSDYLHDGNNAEVVDELELLALDYSRRVIANLLMISDNIQEIRKKLEYDGFGNNPFNALF